MDFDVIVIGSGFGGAISGCRLAEAGYKALILERGRRWDKSTYPRGEGDPWLWNEDHPEKENGWIDFRVFPHMAVAQGAAVGGGSLIYANISCEAPKDTFDKGWPKEITYSELKPHYDSVAKFMNVQKVPANQWTDRMRLMQESANKIGAGDRFKQLELAVSFDPDWNYNLNDPHNASHSKRFVNAQGVEQGTCTHIGNCDIGCDVDAKNTLDRNYLPWAENKYHADVRELHLVSNIEATSGGYKVSWDQLKNGARIPGSGTARIVIVACGSLGSTDLLLRCRELTKSLPNVSPFLGHNWSSNGDFLTPAFYGDRAINPSVGPTIASAIDFLDRSQSGQSFWIEDGGFPNLLNDFVSRAAAKPGNAEVKLLIDSLCHLLSGKEPFRNVMPWFAQGVDAANGTFSLHHSILTGKPCLNLSWDIGKSKATMDAIVATHLKLSAATGGTPVVPPTWTLLHNLVTPHPLGGACMGDSVLNGVVNHAGEVFNYRNLYVIDGSIVPEALGVNPSRTIGALAERAAGIIKSEGR